MERPTISVGRVIAQSVRAMGSHVGAFAVIVALVSATLVAINRSSVLVLGEDFETTRGAQVAMGMARWLVTSWAVPAASAITLGVGWRRAWTRGLASNWLYLAGLFGGVAMCFVPAVVFVAMSFPIVSVAIAENRSPRAAWTRTTDLTKGQAVQVLALAAPKFVLAMAFNAVWPGTGPLADRLDGGDATWTALALVHNAVVGAVMVIDGVLSALAYRALVGGERVDAVQVASTFE